MEILLKFSGSLLARTPCNLLNRLCYSLAVLFIFYPSRRRRVLLSNLRHTFPHWSSCQLRTTATRSAACMIEMGLFSLAYPFMTRVQKRHCLHVPPETERQLDEIRSSDQPILFLLPHVSLFETLAVSPYFRPNRPKENGAIYRPNRNPVLDDWIREARIANGITLFSRMSGLKKAMYFLRRGNWLTVLFDQNGVRMEQGRCSSIDSLRFQPFQIC